jgi:hypothetical protein
MASWCMGASSKARRKARSDTPSCGPRPIAPEIGGFALQGGFREHRGGFDDAALEKGAGGRIPLAAGILGLGNGIVLSGGMGMGSINFRQASGQESREIIRNCTEAVVAGGVRRVPQASSRAEGGGKRRRVMRGESMVCVVARLACWLQMSTDSEVCQ